MRRSALFLAFAVTSSSLVGLVTPAAYAASSLSAATTTPFVGQETIMTANTGTAVARPIVLEGSSGKTWVVMRSVTTDADGTVKFQIGTGAASRAYRAVAKAAAGQPAVTSNTVTLKTKSVEGAPKTASLKATPKKPYAYQPFKFTGSTGAPNRTIILQGKSGSAWVASRTSTTDGSGKFEFNLASALPERDFRVLVPSFKLDGPILSEAPVTLETKKNGIGLVLNRVGSKIVADGYLDAKQEGRDVLLQKVVSNKWVTVAQADQDGNNHVSFDGYSISQTTANYRLVANVSDEGAPQVVSNMSSLSYGPSKLGPRVLYAQTKNLGTPTKKGVDYVGTVQLGNLTASIETIAVRGNSSADFKKQGYKLQFDDDQTPFGLPEGKNFNLLPNLQDHSLIRTAVSFTTAQKLSGLKWTPHRIFTELYLNGKYRGSYELVESIKIETAEKRAPRVNIDAKTGVIMEFDHKPETALFSFKLSKSGNYVKFKDPDDKKTGDEYYEGITGDKVQKMKARLINFENVLYGSNWKSDTSGWKAYLDINSAVDFYLYSEFIKNWDGDMFASVFFYTNDYRDSKSKLIMSPVWDPDRTAGAKTSGTSNVTSPQGWWMNGEGGGHLNQSGDVHTRHWFTRLTDDPDFQAALRTRWDVVQGAFASAGYSTIDGPDGMYTELTRTAADNDRALWQSYKPLGRYGQRSSSYSGELNYLRTWYRARYSWMNGKLEKN